MSEYTLGPLPWSEQTLQEAYWRDFRKARESIKEHPAHDLHERTLSLRAVLRMFNGAAQSFVSTRGQFQTEVHGGGLLHRNRRDHRQAFEEKFQEILYLFASAAMTLVDQSRALSKKVKLRGYTEHVSCSFRENPRHRFIQELRNDLIHVTLHRPSWNLRIAREGTQTTRFMLYPDQLRQRSKEWHQLAIEYLRQHPKGVDLGLLIQEYRLEVSQFQEWLQESVHTAAGEAIDDYLRCDRFFRAIESRCHWRLLLSQIVIPKSLDPYQYLNRYLTLTEFAEIEHLPHRSKDQVDRIIEFVDEYHACDAELRSLVYKAFGVSTSKT